MIHLMYLLFFISAFTLILGGGVMGVTVDFFTDKVPQPWLLVITLASLIVVLTSLASIYFGLFEMFYKSLKLKYHAKDNKFKRMLFLTSFLFIHVMSSYYLGTKEIWIGVVILMSLFGKLVKDFMDDVYQVEQLNKKEE